MTYPKFEKLILAAENINWIFVSSEFDKKQGFRVQYIDMLKAGQRPQLEYCRDEVDYDLLMQQWAKRGTIFSEYYDTSNEMFTQEIRRLNGIRKALE